jgi:hypothetical protein
MKVTKDNYKQIEHVYGQDWVNYDLIYILLCDLENLNKIIEYCGKPQNTLCIEYEDTHTEYSPERVDPCPDYYGSFSLRFDCHPDYYIRSAMDLDELDYIIFSLNNFMEVWSECTDSPN